MTVHDDLATVRQAYWLFEEPSPRRREFTEALARVEAEIARLKQQLDWHRSQHDMLRDGWPDGLAERAEAAEAEVAAERETRDVQTDAIKKLQSERDEQRRRLVDYAERLDRALGERNAAEAEVARLRDGLKDMGDLLFGTWDDGSTGADRHRKAEGIARALLADQDGAA